MFKSVSRITNKLLNIKPKYVHYKLIKKQPNLLPNKPKVLANTSISFEEIRNGIIIFCTPLYFIYKYYNLPHDKD